jgi:hypothetical protein
MNQLPVPDVLGLIAAADAAVAKMRKGVEDAEIGVDCFREAARLRPGLWDVRDEAVRRASVLWCLVQAAEREAAQLRAGLEPIP